MNVPELNRLLFDLRASLQLGLRLADAAIAHLNGRNGRPPARSPPSMDDNAAERVYIGRFVVDRTTFSVTDGDRICELGNTICFRLLECLASSPDRHFTCAQLIARVWDGQRRESTTVRSAMFELRTRLRDANMHELAAALRAEGRAYRLALRV